MFATSCNILTHRSHTEEFDEDHRPLGIARISFGASSQFSDVVAFVDFIRRFFTETEDTMTLSRPSRTLVQSPIRLERLTVCESNSEIK